jgi:hypothetical protein
MNVDEGTEVDTTSFDPGTPDTGTAAPTEVETQLGAVPQEAGANSERKTDQLGADTRTNRDSSSATPNAIPQNTQKGFGEKPPTAPVDWQKRYSDLQSKTQRDLNQIQARERQGQAELEQLRQFRQQQMQQAESAKLRQWSKQHPEHGKFQSLLQRAQTVRQQLANVNPDLPPDQQKALKETILSALSPEDQTTLQDYQQESQTFQRDFFIDPRGTIQPMMREAIQEAFDQFRMHQEASAAVDRDFKQMGDALKEHGPELRKLLERNVPYDVATENVRLKAQLGALQNRVGESEQVASAAKEQQRLAKGNASITRDPAPNSKVDVYALAKKEAASKDIRTDDPRFMAILSRIEANTLKT